MEVPEVRGHDEADYQRRRAQFDDTWFLFVRQEVGSSDIDQTQYGFNAINRGTFERILPVGFTLVSYEEAAISQWQDLAIVARHK
jgi:hypothetical protein